MFHSWPGNADGNVIQITSENLNVFSFHTIKCISMWANMSKAKPSADRLTKAKKFLSCSSHVLVTSFRYDAILVAIE